MSSPQRPTYRSHIVNVLFVAGCVSLAALTWSSSWTEAALEGGAGLVLLGISHLFFSLRARWEYLYRPSKVDSAIVEQREKP